MREHDLVGCCERLQPRNGTPKNQPVDVVGTWQEGHVGSSSLQSSFVQAAVH